jgi:hypothetical protein
VKKERVNPLDRKNAAYRCSAKSKRSGVKCQSPAIRGRIVCRVYGAMAGAPKGSANGLYRHGLFTFEAVNQKRVVAALVRLARASANTLCRPLDDCR